MAVAGEPGRQQQGQGNLGDKVHNPELHGVAQGLNKRGVLKDADKVLERLVRQEVPGRVSQALAVREAQEGGVNGGIQGEDAEGHDEGQAEQIAVPRVAEAFSLLHEISAP